MSKLIKIAKLNTIVVMMVLMFVSFNAKAGKEKYSNNASTKAASTTMLTNTTVLIVQDPRYVTYLSNPSAGWPGSPSTPTSAAVKFYDKEIKNRVIFNIDYSDKTATSGLVYNATINFKVIYSIYNTTTSSFQTFIQNKSLTVSSNQLAIDKDKAVCEFIGGNNLQVQVTGITFSNPLINLTNARIQLEAEMEIERYHYFDPTSIYSTSNLKHCSNNLATKGELDIFWLPIVGAEEYELEWVFVNNYLGTMSLGNFNHIAAVNIPIDEKIFDYNATRITTANSFYKIPYIYERGYILYRIRALGRTSVTNWSYNVPAGWSTDMTVTTPAPPINVSQFVNKFPAIATANGCAVTTETFVGLNEGLNWQSGISYAEEGKSKAVVSFSDGSLRNRQSVTKLKSKNEIVVGETIYDFQGRPAINVLPVPSSALQKIEYTPNFNMIGASNPFDAADFDFDNGGNCGSASPVLVNTAGAAKYYSSNNGLLTDENAYIPDAQGYPYTQTEFMPDNTGRIRNQSGVGPDHKLNSDHETKYYYGTPEQKDIDRLFGSEVGDAIKYKKNMVIDANGQPSITYLDPTGKTIATALAATSPTALNALPSQGTLLTTYDLLNKTVPTDNSGSLNLLDLANKKLSLNKTLLVPSNGPYTFTYSVKPPNFVDNCGAALFVPPGSTVTTTGTKCYNCILDTKISLKNECGEELFSNIYPITPTPTNPPTAYNFTTTGAISTSCAATNPSLSSIFTPSDLTNTISSTYLKPGSYVLEKSLSVNQAALDIYTKDYLDTLLNPCILKFSDFKNAQNAKMDITGCAISCTACIAKLGSISQYTAPTCTVCLTQAEYDGLYAECMEMCSDESSKCENALAQMLSDMSPSGQYGKYSPGGGVDANGYTIPPDPNNIQPWLFPLSVFNTSTQLPFKSSINTTFTVANEVYNNVGNYKPNWRHPYNPNEATNAKKFAYLDENKNIVYIKVTGTSPTFSPAVSPLHVNDVVTINGENFIEPRFLLNLSDFLNLWEPEWAYSLLAYHPEYVFYERCLVDMPSNNFDASFIETDKLVDVKNYVTTVLGFNAVDLMYPLGIPPSGTTCPSGWSGNVIDPYFKASGPTGSGYGELCNIRNAMRNYMYDPLTSSYISIWDAAYRIVNCPNGIGGGLCPTTSMTPSYTFTTDEEWQTFRGMYLSLKQSFQDRVNTVHGMNQTSYNQCIGANPFDPFENNFYDPNNNVLTFTPISASFSTFWNSSPFSWFFWNWYTINNISQYNNPEQTCNSSKHYLYANKQARFPTMKMMMPDMFGGGGAPCYDDKNNIIPCPVNDLDAVNQMGNQADMALFQSCGQCPTAVNFQQLLKALATLSTTTGQKDLTNTSTPGVKLTCAPATSLHKEFTIEMAQNLFGASTPTIDVYWKSIATASPLFLHGNLVHNTTTVNVAIVMPSTVVPLYGIPGYTTSSVPNNYGPFANIYTFNDVIDICCLKYNAAAYTFSTPVGFQNGVGRFTALVTVKCKSGDPNYISSTNVTYRQIAVEGNVSGIMDFKVCNFKDVCKPSKQIKRLQNLINALLHANPSTVTPSVTVAPEITGTAIQLNSSVSVYKSMMQPDLVNDLDAVVDPSVYNVNDIWFWDYQSAASTTKKIVGTIKPNPSASSCTVIIALPSSTAIAVVANLLKISGVKPSTVSVGAFNAYGLFKDAAATPSVQWVPITGTTTCLNVGTCGQETESNFQLNTSTGDEESAIPPTACNLIYSDAPEYVVNHLNSMVTQPTYSTNFASNTTNIYSTGTYTYFNGTSYIPCNFTLTIPPTEPQSYIFNQIISIYTVITTPNSNGGVSPYFNAVATATSLSGSTVITNTIIIKGFSSCFLADGCPTSSPCKNSGNLVVNGDFEQGNYDFGSTYTYTANTSLATSAITPTYFPYSTSSQAKKYNVYPIAQAFNLVPTATASAWVSNHTGVIFTNPMPDYFSPQIGGNGNALAARNETNIDSISGPGTKVGYVWTQYVNLAKNQNYKFKAFVRGVGPFVDTTNFNTIVCELYVNGQLHMRGYNVPTIPANYACVSYAMNHWAAITSSVSYNSGSTNFTNVHLGIKVYYAKYSSGSILPYSSSGRVDDLFLLDDISFEGCMPGNSLACNVPPSFEEDPEDDCLSDAENTAFESAEYLYNAYVDSLRKAFQAKYIAKCLDTYEDFFMKCNDTDHHYTLYYYDQAGNLVKTVPPQGVVKIPDGDPKLAQIKLDRKNNTQTVFTAHTYATNYRYNSLNQLVSQSMPDNNDLAIWGTNNFLGVNPSHNIQSVSFNGSSGFAVANDGTNGYLYTFNPTSNQWVLVPSLNVSTLNSVAYVNSSTAYAVGKNGTILRTINNGGNWTLMPFADGSAELIKVYQYDNTSTPAPAAVAFDKNGNRYVSNGNGDVWTKTNNVFGLIGGETLKDVDFNYSTPTGLAVSSLSKIYTYNGSSWITNSNNFYQAALNKVTGDGSNTMYAVGKDGTVIKSTNNGNNWTELISNTSGELIDANFFSANNGYLLDNNNKIYSTYNGAVTLNQINTVSYINSPTSVVDIDYNSGMLFALKPTTSGAIYTFSAGIWAASPIALPSGTAFTTIHAESATNLYGGGVGVLSYYNGTSWLPNMLTGTLTAETIK